MKSRYIIGFFTLFLTAGILLTASYQYTYRRALDRQMAQDEATGGITGEYRGRGRRGQRGKQ